jgi:hypothetical protein
MNSKIVCYDVESNGFKGESFAVGAVSIGDEGDVIDKFFGKTFLTGHPQQWVVDNVLPALVNEKNTHTQARDMRVDFYRWLESIAGKYNILVFADWCHPVDSRFMLSVQQELPAGMAFRLPIVHEAATLFLATGRDVDTSRYDLVKDELQGREVKKHHPLWDAEVSARAIRRLMKELEGRRPPFIKDSNGKEEKHNGDVTEIIAKAIDEGRIESEEVH